MTISNILWSHSIHVIRPRSLHSIRFFDPANNATYYINNTFSSHVTTFLLYVLCDDLLFCHQPSIYHDFFWKPTKMLALSPTHSEPQQVYDKKTFAYSLVLIKSGVPKKGSGLPTSYISCEK